MYECRHCVSIAARAILQRESLSVPHRGIRARPPDTPRITSLNQRSFIHSTTVRRSHKDDETVPFDSATKKLEIPPVPRRHLELELRWFPDRVKFAQHIRKVLYELNDPPKALALLRLKSKPEYPQFCTVAWNHVLNYHLTQGQTSRAFELFNDMKKRGQKPDEMTYLFLLRGLVNSDEKMRRPTQAQMARVVSVFESMFAANSKVKPTTAHADAALMAVTSDVDKVWKIISLLPEDGSCAPQLSTYTAILRAIKESMYKSGDTEQTDEERTALRTAALERSRDIWSIVVNRWKAGKMKLDEGLVIGMANVLLRSPQMRDWDDILNLLQQTADVPRQISALGSAERKTGHVPNASSTSQQQVSDAADHVSPEDSAEDIFRSVAVHTDDCRPGRRAKRGQPTHVQPTDKLLTVALRACLKMRAPRAANDYWQYFVGQSGVVPSIESVNEMLNICSINRSSAKAAEILVAQFSSSKLVPDETTFKHALKACQRNINARNSIVHAGEIIKVMGKQCSVPYIQILADYISFAKAVESGDRIVQAINNIDEPLQTMRTMFTTGSLPPIWTAEEQDQYRKQAITLYNSLISAMDLLVSHKLVPQDQFKLWSARRSDLIAFAHPLRTSVSPAIMQERLDSTFAKERRSYRLSSTEQNVSSTGISSSKDSAEPARPRTRSQQRGERKIRYEKLGEGLSVLPMDNVRTASYASS